MIRIRVSHYQDFQKFTEVEKSIYTISIQLANRFVNNVLELLVFINKVSDIIFFFQTKFLLQAVFADVCTAGSNV